MEWNGDWSDNSALWTAEAKKQVNWQQTDDGTFWICLKDYFTFFSVTTICYSSGPAPEKVTIKCDIHEQDTFGIVKMTVPEDITSHLVITLDQIASRFVDELN